MKKEIRLRKATMEDLDLIFEWANDPMVRKNSFNSDFIKYEDHVTWYKNSLESKSRMIYILICKENDEENNIGQVRIDVDGTEAMLSYMIDKKYRGNGYGNIIIDLACSVIKNDMKTIKVIKANVKADNDASKRVFSGNRFKESYIQYEMEI